MKNPTSPHHHNGKPELEQHIHAYNPRAPALRRRRLRFFDDMPSLTPSRYALPAVECSVFLGPWFLVVSGCVFAASQLVFDLVGGAVAER